MSNFTWTPQSADAPRDLVSSLIPLYKLAKHEQTLLDMDEGICKSFVKNPDSTDEPCRVVRMYY